MSLSDPHSELYDTIEKVKREKYFWAITSLAQSYHHFQRTEKWDSAQEDKEADVIAQFVISAL